MIHYPHKFLFWLLFQPLASSQWSRSQAACSSSHVTPVHRDDNDMHTHKTHSQFFLKYPKFTSTQLHIQGQGQSSLYPIKAKDALSLVCYSQPSVHTNFGMSPTNFGISPRSPQRCLSYLWHQIIMLSLY